MWTYQGKEEGGQNLRGKHACKRDMTEAGLKEDNATNRAAWRKKLISYTPDDGTSQGRRNHYTLATQGPTCCTQKTYISSTSQRNKADTHLSFFLRMKFLAASLADVILFHFFFISSPAAPSSNFFFCITMHNIHLGEIEHQIWVIIK